MTRDDMICMAREAGLLHESDTAQVIDECGVEVWLSRSDGVKTLQRFAALVAAAEREACAKVCDYVHELEVLANPAEKCAAAIRSRGETT